MNLKRTAVVLVLATTAIGCVTRPRQPFSFLMRDDGQWETASNAHRLSEFPKVHEDGRVWFQFDAPETAYSVALRIDGENYDMAMDGSGLWNVVVPRLQSGFRIYSFVVDGVSIRDPNSTPYYVNGYVSALEYPPSGEDFYAVKPVPHGDVREHWFYSDVAGEFRRMYVYTPPGYDDIDTRYPVLYLQHGGGELEDEWVHSARANFILDNLLAEGDARPMIIVMNMGFVTRAGTEDSDGFEDMLLDEVIPDVDASFRTLPDPAHRAMAGLSRGGGQTFNIGLTHTDTFGSLGVFSSGLFRNVSGSAFDDEIPGLLTRAESFNDALDLLYLSVGEQDERLEATQAAVATFRAHSLEVEFASFPGAHEWRVWRSSLHDFAQRLFE